MREITLEVTYERPSRDIVFLYIPEDIEEGSDEWDQYIQDNIPYVHAYAVDWEVI